MNVCILAEQRLTISFIFIFMVSYLLLFFTLCSTKTDFFLTFFFSLYLLRLTFVCTSCLVVLYVRINTEYIYIDIYIACISADSYWMGYKEHMTGVTMNYYWIHDDVIWKHFPRYWPFVGGIHRSPVNSPHKGQWRGALVFSMICAWINGQVNNREAGDLRRHPTHYGVIVMYELLLNSYM